MIDNFAANDLYNCIDSLDSSDFQKFLAGNNSSIFPTIATNRATSLFKEEVASIDLDLTTLDNAGNTLATARDITIGATPTSYSDFVGSTDTNDYYRFSLGTSSDFSLNLTGLSADADVSLLDSNGSEITSSTNGSTISESIIRQLNAGTYFVLVYPYSGSTNYDLSLAATVGIPDNAGNTLATARDITIGATPTSYSDFVGSTDT
ncbi:MAG: PPC domain-containing protein, partial [Microcystis sp.]